MAITKIKVIRTNLAYCINYAINPEKTQDGGHKIYVTAVNCSEQSVYSDMMETKRRFSKESHKVLGYHIIQSFRPGEVTPEQAHEIGSEFAKRYLSDKYEAVVATHLDRGHLHCHIMFKSVSFVDGSMYKNRLADYYGGIRQISDELCREHKLSVIENPQGKGKHRLEWEAEKRGEPTLRSMLKDDIDDIISKSLTFQTFIEQLRKRGYKVKHGTNVKHMAVKPPSGDRYIRLRSLGADYTEDAIRARLKSLQHKAPPKKQQHRTSQAYRYVGVFTQVKRKKLHGFMALYFRYLYMLGKIKKRTATRKQTRLLSPEIVKFKQYLDQHRFVCQNKIETLDDLNACRESNADNRRELRMCDNIEKAVPHMREQLQKVETKIKTKERDKTLEFSR